MAKLSVDTLVSTPANYSLREIRDELGKSFREIVNSKKVDSKKVKDTFALEEIVTEYPGVIELHDELGFSFRALAFSDVVGWKKVKEEVPAQRLLNSSTEDNTEPFTMVEMHEKLGFTIRKLVLDFLVPNAQS